MSIGFFIIGGIVFVAYMYLTFWNIVYSSKKQRQENYPNLGSEGADEPTGFSKKQLNVSKSK